MKSSTFSQCSKLVGTLLPAIALFGCGGGTNTGTLTLSSSLTTATASIGVSLPVITPVTPVTPADPVTPITPVTPADPVTPVTPVVPPLTVDGVVTDLGLVSTDSATHTNVPVTFGQVFVKGDLGAGVSLSGKLPNGAIVPLQVDVKNSYADGSIRHAILSAVVPSVSTSEVRMSLARSNATIGTAALPAGLIAAGFTSSVNIKVDGQTYSVAADQLLKNGTVKTWLSGPLVSEWLVSAPLKTAAGVDHPHLTARYAIRWYSGVGKARIDVSIDNDWAYETNPRNFVYDATVLVGGKTVYSVAALNHYHHARWRKTFWWGDAPQIHLKHNTKYLIASKAVPNYDQTISVAESALAAASANWKGANIEPMGVGAAYRNMPETGARPDIGLLPAWTVNYLLSMDKRAKDVMLGTADLAGSWSIHYRDKKSDRPITLQDYPYMTLAGNTGDTFNPTTQKFESFPACAAGADCSTPYFNDLAHQPSLTYLPYLVTGDYYYLEELQFWASTDILTPNPGYRSAGKGIFSREQIRGQAWNVRTIAEAAFITPSTDTMKTYFETILSNNLDYYNVTYTNNTSANALGILENGYAYAYNNGIAIAPWQDDFFTSAVGLASDMGFTKADNLLVWKAKYPIARMLDSCWINAAPYYMNVRDSVNSPAYSTMAETYKVNNTVAVNAVACGSAEMAAAFSLRVGEMTGYADSATGYPSDMQPALAYGASVSGKRGSDAWALFAKRPIKPNYSTEPQFSIVPR